MMLFFFFALAVVAVGGAISLILQPHPIHSALSLIFVMGAIAGEFLLLGATFISAVQVIVYAGAIMVLFVFVIMLLNAGVEERTHFSRMATYAGLPLAVVLAAGLTLWATRGAQALGTTPVSVSSTRRLATLLFQSYAFPFELTSILILIAILGALVLAQRHGGTE
jgi:NADH-quinone oxidoreductase subunit J